MWEAKHCSMLFINGPEQVVRFLLFRPLGPVVRFLLFRPLGLKHRVWQMEKSYMRAQTVCIIDYFNFI